MFLQVTDSYLGPAENGMYAKLSLLSLLSGRNLNGSYTCITIFGTVQMSCYSIHMLQSADGNNFYSLAKCCCLYLICQLLFAMRKTLFRDAGL